MNPNFKPKAMITFTRSYQTSDGQCVATLEEAQRKEIIALFEREGRPDDTPRSYAEVIVASKDEILAILTLTDASRPRARGMKKPRKPKVAEATAAA